jgi:hypothetical protein
MSMDEYYQRWHQLTDELHYKVQDHFEDPQASYSQALKDEMRELINDLSLQQPPRNIEVRIEKIINLLEPARSGAANFMSVQDAVTYHDAFERLRREVRQHPHHS